MSDQLLSTNCNDCEYISNCLMRFVDEKTDSNNMHTSYVKYLRRQTLCKEGEFSSCIKLILTGFVMVLVEGPDKRNIIVKILKSGDFLGVSAISGDATYAFTAIALTDALVCSIDRDSVLNLIVTNGNSALELTKWYCSNYSRLFGKLKILGFKNLHGRMADSILYLDSEEFKEGNLYNYLNRKDIADLSGMPMESAVRILSEFSESNIIKITGKEIEIVDSEMLNRISRGG